MATSAPRVYTFKSGYQFWVNEYYTPILLDLAVASWRADHGQPQPPTKFKEVPVKNGVESIAFTDWNDSTYLALYSVWLSDLQNYQEQKAIRLACDYTRLDEEVLNAAREYAEGMGLQFFSDDAILFAQVVSERVIDQKTRKTEYDLFIDWLKSLGGPSEALIDMFLKRRVQNRNPVQGANDQSLGLPDVREPETEQPKAPKSKSAVRIDLSQGGN